MTADELRAALVAAGISQCGAARELGINERTMRRYIAGDDPIPKAIGHAVRWITRPDRPKEI